MIQPDIELCIREMRVAEFYYKGSWRSVEPHLLGVNKRGNLCLSAFQLSGGSAQDWRAFLLDEIGDLTVTDQFFSEVREGYNPNDQTMVRIICCI